MHKPRCYRAHAMQSLAYRGKRLPYPLLLLPLLWGLSACEHWSQPYVERKLHLSPDNPSSPNPYLAKSCSEIYAEAYRLFPYTYAGATGFYDDDRNAAIAAAGLSFEPAFLGWVYTGTRHYLKDQTALAAEFELELLRQASALNRCWLR